jgi:hypothetical protein
MDALEQRLSALNDCSRNRWIGAPFDLFDTSIVYPGNAKLYQDRINWALKGVDSHFRLLVRINMNKYQIRVVSLYEMKLDTFELLSGYLHDA